MPPIVNVISPAISIIFLLSMPIIAPCSAHLKRMRIVAHKPAKYATPNSISVWNVSKHNAQLASQILN